MALSYTEFGTKSPGDTITVSFPFRSRDEVYVVVGEADVSASLYSWVSDGLISCGAGFPGGAGRVERRTPISDYDSVQSGSSVYDWRGANGNFEQALFILQEYSDGEADRDAKVEEIAGEITTIVEARDTAVQKALEASGSATDASGSAASALAALDEVTGIAASKLGKSDNLGDLADAAAARSNLGLGSAAQKAESFFAPVASPAFSKSGTFYANHVPGATILKGSDRAFFGAATVDTGHDPRASRILSSLTRSGTTATGIAERDHEMVPGDQVTISNISQAAYNGTFTVLTTPNATTFTFAVSGSPTTPATAVAGRVMRMDSVPLGVESWLEKMRVNTVRGSYIAALSGNGMCAATFGTRTSDLPGSGYSVGAQFWGMNDAGIPGRYAWAFYAEARRFPGSDFTVTTEWDIANYGSEVEFNVYGAGTSNLSGQLWLASGGDVTQSSYVINNASFGIAFIQNGAKYLTGIGFASDSLADKTVGPLTLKSAMKLGTSMMLEWFNASNQRTAFITSRVTDQTKGTSLHFTDGGLYLMDYTGTNILLRVQNQSASAVNGVRVLSTNAGNSPIIDPHDGGDANVNLNLRGRGTGSVLLTDPSGNSKVAANSTGLGFFNATPVAKPTVSGSRGGNAALASLLTQLASLGLVTDGSSA